MNRLKLTLELPANDAVTLSMVLEDISMHILEIGRYPSDLRVAKELKTAEGRIAYCYTIERQ